MDFPYGLYHDDETVAILRILHLFVGKLLEAAKLSAVLCENYSVNKF
jgi:hypothetical protein